MTDETKMPDFNAEIYNSLKAMFERLIDIAFDKATRGDDYREERDRLLEAFNNTADGNKRLMDEVQHLKRLMDEVQRLKRREDEGYRGPG